ncbi:MAG: DUF262 domain-containing HNH endonuclease family protein [Pseudomonadota bacterium]
MRRPVEPEAIGFGDFLQSHTIRPANVQRDYVWTGVQVSALVDDLLGYLDRKNANIASPGYFIGAFVSYSEQPGSLRLYDGLQRTTTLTLLMAMVRDFLAGEPLADALHACICRENGAVRFVLGGEDKTLIRYVQPMGATAKWPKTQKVFRRFVVIEEARQTILDEFEARGMIEGGAATPAGRSRLRGLANVLTTDLYIVHLQAETRAIALRMFETVNMRGVTMEDVDLIKTRLPKLAGSPGEAEALLLLWDRLRGRVRYAFRDFILAIDIVHRNLTAEPEPLPFEALTDWMAAMREDDPKFLQDWLKGLAHLANAWNDIHAVQKPGWVGSPGLHALRPIWVIDWFEWKPFAILLLREWQKRRNAARNMGQSVEGANMWLAGHLDQLQRACMALDLARDEPRRRRAYFYGARKILLENKDAETFLPSIKAPRQRRIRNTLSGPIEDRTLRLRLLTWLEASHDPTAIPHLLRNGRDTPTVEHILPQNPEPGSAWFDTFADQVTVRRSRNLLGNLALIPSGLNSRMENKSYADKRAFVTNTLKMRKGYAAALQSFREVQWDQAAIDRRTQSLGKAVWQALGLSGTAPQFITNAARENEIEPEIDYDTGT